jgi:hypothetical protein
MLSADFSSFASTKRPLVTSHTRPSADGGDGQLPGCSSGQRSTDLAHPAGHAWPGNFRVLRAVLTCALLQRAAAHRRLPMSLGDVQAVLPAAPPHAPASRLQQGADEFVHTAYERCGHSVSQTARALGGFALHGVAALARRGGRERLTPQAWVGATLRACFAVPSLPLSAPPTPRTQRRCLQRDATLAHCQFGPTAVNRAQHRAAHIT